MPYAPEMQWIAATRAGSRPDDAAQALLKLLVEKKNFVQLEVDQLERAITELLSGTWRKEHESTAQESK